MRQFWTKSEDDILYKHYYELPKELLCGLLPNRTWSAIKLRARKLDLYRSLSFARNSNVKMLLSGSLISFYWVGFILADGHISNNNRLKIVLSNKDSEHLNSLATFLSTNVRNSVAKVGNKKFNTVTISCKDIDNIPVICDIFGIKANKTKNPPDFYDYMFTEEQLLALIVGFIDGDGNISMLHNRTDVNLRIKCHRSWLSNLGYIENIIYNYTDVPLKSPPLTKINNQGYAQLVISNNKVIKAVKQFAIDKKLPIMQRKWGRVK